MAHLDFAAPESDLPLVTRKAAGDTPPTLSDTERDPGLAVHLAGQLGDEGDFGRLVTLAGAHDDRRNRVLLVERPVHDIVATQALDGDWHQADADLGGYQAERRLKFSDLVYRAWL